MSSKYTTLGLLLSAATTELNALADDTAAAGSIYDNSTGIPLGRVEVSLAAQATARDATAQVSLLIIPEGTSTLYGDISTLRTAQSNIAETVTGKAATWLLDAAVTARVLGIDGIRVPHGNFKWGLLNESSQALAATGSTIKAILYGIEDA